MHQPDAEKIHGPLGFRVLRTDRGGEFIAAIAHEESDCEAWLREEGIELDVTEADDPGMNGKAEVMWRWMDDGAEKLLRMSGLTEQFYVDALIAYVITYNQEGTGANKLGNGEAPWKTMGIRCYRPERLRTFGAFGWLKLPGKHRDEQGRPGGLKEEVAPRGASWLFVDDA